MVRPVLDRLAGRAAALPVFARLTAGHDSALGREDYLRVQLEDREGCTWAKPLSGTSSSLSALATADGVAIIPADVAAAPVQAVIEVLRF